MSRRPGRSQQLPELLLPDAETLAAVRPEIERIRTLQRLYAGPIIAAGLFNRSGDLWSGILAALAKRDGRDYKMALDAFFERLRSAAVDVTVPHRIGSSVDESDLVTDVCLSYAACWGDSGFALGLAVGMQLGPHGFEGGRR
jgi:hypothetical protein